MSHAHVLILHPSFRWYWYYTRLEYSVESMKQSYMFESVTSFQANGGGGKRMKDRIRSTKRKRFVDYKTFETILALRKDSD
jgi:hypothetical protein